MNLKQFLTDYQDIGEIIFEYAYSPLDIENSIVSIELLTEFHETNKYRSFLINNYLKHCYTTDMIDKGINILIKNNMKCSDEFELAKQIFLRNKYRPSIENTMRQYLDCCIRGKVGIVELIFEYLLNNYINTQHNILYRELIHWILLQYALNSTEYTHVKKFAVLKSLTKAFNIKHYSYYNFLDLLLSHVNMLTTDFLKTTIDVETINPINICYLKLVNDGDLPTLYEIENRCLNKLNQLILPSLDALIDNNKFTNINIFNDNLLIVLHQFFNNCIQNTSVSIGDFKTTYNYLNMMVKDDVIMWIVQCYGLNIINISNDKYQFLVEKRRNLETTGLILYESLILLHKYVKYIQHLVLNIVRRNIENKWKCISCTFENNNVLARLCEICGSNRFIE